MSNIKIRVFGSDECRKCQFYLQFLNISCVEYEYLDVLDFKNDKLCEEYDIDELPYTQIVKGEEVLLSVTGNINVVWLLRRKKELEIKHEFKSRTNRSSSTC